MVEELLVCAGLVGAGSAHTLEELGSAAGAGEVFGGSRRDAMALVLASTAESVATFSAKESSFLFRGDRSTIRPG